MIWDARVIILYHSRICFISISICCVQTLRRHISGYDVLGGLMTHIGKGGGQHFSISFIFVLFAEMSISQSTMEINNLRGKMENVHCANYEMEHERKTTMMEIRN